MVQSLNLEDPLEKEMATHSSILAWRILWTEEPGGLQSVELQKSRTGLKRLSTRTLATEQVTMALGPNGGGLVCLRVIMPMFRLGKVVHAQSLSHV